MQVLAGVQCREALVAEPVRRNGQVVATVNARADLTYEHADTAPGEYTVVLQMWRYVNYRKNPQGEFIDSRFIDISNRVTYTI